MRNKTWGRCQNLISPPPIGKKRDKFENYSSQLLYSKRYNNNAHLTSACILCIAVYISPYSMMSVLLGMVKLHYIFMCKSVSECQCKDVQRLKVGSTLPLHSHPKGEIFPEEPHLSWPSTAPSVHYREHCLYIARCTVLT